MDIAGTNEVSGSSESLGPLQKIKWNCRPCQSLRYLVNIKLLGVHVELDGVKRCRTSDNPCSVRLATPHMIGALACGRHQARAPRITNP